jgi:hypothetical protein
MTELLGAIATVIAVAGVVANNRKWRICFWLWLVSNGITAGIHAQAGIWSLCARDLIFLALAVDVVLGRMDPPRVNAACNMLGKVAKFLELQEKYGRPAGPNASKEVHLLPANC